MMKTPSQEQIILGFIDEIMEKEMILNKINLKELKKFVDSDGRIVTNEFKESMKKLHAALSND